MGAESVQPTLRGTSSSSSSFRELFAEPDNRRAALIGGFSVALSVCTLAARLLGLLPRGLTVVIVILASAVAVRVALWFSKRSASSLASARISRMIAYAGLCTAAVSIIASLPVVTRNGGFGDFTTDLLQHLWTLLLLAVLAAPVRTLPWRAFIGAAFAGYLAVSQLAYLIGRPVINSLGQASTLAVGLYVPVTEQLLEALPVLIFVLIAIRSQRQRPSAVDCALFAAWVGAGYAIYENAEFGRVGGSFSGAGAISFLFPSSTTQTVFLTTTLVAGHMVWDALVGLGIGVSFLYGHRYRLAWLAAPVAFLVALAEHCVTNSLSVTVTGTGPLVVRLLKTLTLNGHLSVFLLVAGLILMLLIEWRAVRSGGDIRQWIQLPPPLAGQRSSRLARLQLAPAATSSGTEAAPASRLPESPVLIDSFRGTP